MYVLLFACSFLICLLVPYLIDTFSGKKMPSGDANINEYEQRRLENIERNKRTLADLNVRAMLDDMAQQCRPKKTTKVICKHFAVHNP